MLTHLKFRLAAFVIWAGLLSITIMWVAGV